MKKIGILTITDYTNYGNRLQNFASQEVIKSLGFECQTIVNSPIKKQSVLERIKKNENETLLDYSVKSLKKVRVRLYKTTQEKKMRNLKMLKTLSFKKFTNENIRETPFSITPENIYPDINDEFDFFITGSDQVWNPNYRFGSSIDFLVFASKKKRIAYSASFGISEIPNEHITDYTKWLNEMAHISVREDDGAKIVKSLTGKVPEVLVDPTLMLTKENWLAISKTAKHKPTHPYLLTYFLGRISEETKNIINSIANQYSLEIINMNNIYDEERYIAGPSEFLDYINSSEIFLTDSFHGAVFSILFEKPFFVFDRVVGKSQPMNSRIDTLLSTFKLIDRKSTYINKSTDIFDIDFSHIPCHLEIERTKSLNFLNKAFRIEE